MISNNKIDLNTLYYVRNDRDSMKNCLLNLLSKGYKEFNILKEVEWNEEVHQKCVEIFDELYNKEQQK